MSDDERAHDDEGEKESWETRDSGSVQVPRSRRRARISEIATGQLHRSEVQRRIADARGPSPARLADLSAIASSLARGLDPTADEEEQLATALGCWTTRLPARRFVVRLVDRDTGVVDLVRSTARLEEEPERVRVTTAALGRAGLTLDDAHHAGLEVVLDYQPDFAIGARGYDACLVVDGQLFGVVGMEYAPPHGAPEGDAEILDVLACQLAATLQRARVRHEASYLSSYLARVLDHARVPIAVLDRQRRVRVASHELLALLGRSRESLVGEELLRSVRTEDRVSIGAAIDAALGTHVASKESLEIALTANDGAPVRLLAHLVPVLTPDGATEGLLLLGRDVTELRELEHQVRHAEKLATLGQLAAGVVHELNNPLTSIAVYSDYLFTKWTRENQAEEDRQKLQRIRQAADRVIHFSRDLVTYARPSREEASPLRLHDAIEQALGFCEHVLADVGATVERKLAVAETTVMGVRSQLHQVFVNLVTNACHAMPEGVGRLVIESEVGDGRVRVRVRDNGAGISPDHLDHIFEPFFTTKGEGQGTGLGLSIAKRIVEHHGGRLRATSRLGDGTTFEIELPLS
ncbi:MAG: PAS domain-containing protein [Sandaracinus sp.]|nr:PAS domain-containing protein [Sandaracinus sp.]